MKLHVLNCIALATALAFGASAYAADTMTKAEFKDAKAKIEADYKAALVPCGALSGNPKKICTVEAKGNKPTPSLIACLQPDRRVDVQVTGER